MLLRMMPEKAAEMWHEIVPVMLTTLPEDERGQDVINNVLSMVVSNIAQIWLSYEQGEEKKINGMVFTSTIYDGFTGSKNLLVYSLAKIGDIDSKTVDKMTIEGFEALSKYAKKHGFKKLIGYTELDRVKEIVENLNGKVTSMVTIPFGG